MSTQTEIAIINQQPIPGNASTCAVLDGLVQARGARGYLVLDDVYCLVTQAYSYGIMQGKRMERARRKDTTYES